MINDDNDDCDDYVDDDLQVSITTHHFCKFYKNDTETDDVDDDVHSGVQGLMTYHYSPAPRFFVVNPCDLSGVELFRWDDLCEYLSAAEADPAALVLKDALVDCPGVVGISVMKPRGVDPTTRWVVPYRESCIVPSGLRSRDLRSLPAKEVRCIVQAGFLFKHISG